MADKRMIDLGTTDSTRTPRRRAGISLLGMLAATAALLATTMVSTSAGAAPVPISGTASVAIGFSTVTLPVPQDSTFTGSLDTTTGAITAKVADVPIDIALPIGTDTYGFTGKLSNPTSYTGTVTGTTVTLTGTSRFALTGATIPGIDPALTGALGLLGCTLDFKPTFTGTYDAVAGTVTVSDDAISVPQFPGLCAVALNTLLSSLGVDLDVNDLLGQLPPAAATMTLAFDTPLVTTTIDNSVAPSSSVAPPSSVAPSSSVAPPTEAPTTSTGAPITLAPGSDAGPSTTIRSQDRTDTTHRRADGSSRTAPRASAVRATPAYTG